MSNPVGQVVVIDHEKDYVVVDKPAGLLVHGRGVNDSDETLVSWLLKKYPEVKEVGDDTDLRPGIVQRLDKEVSGVMVVALTKKGYSHLKEQFKSRSVYKQYAGLVYGQVARDEGHITLPLKKGRGRTIVKPQENCQNGVKQAETSFEVKKRYQHYTYLSIVIKTGRTHQIRAHFKNYGHSLVGDSKYCHPRYRNRKSFTKFIKYDRVFLHSSRLKFNDIYGEVREYEVPLPGDLSRFLETLT